MTFGQFVKVFMTDAGMNQKQLAERIGISTPVMCDILTNKRGFTVKQAKKCQEIFGVPAVIFLMILIQVIPTNFLTILLWWGKGLVLVYANKHPFQ